MAESDDDEDLLEPYELTIFDLVYHYPAVQSRVLLEMMLTQNTRVVRVEKMENNNSNTDANSSGPSGWTDILEQKHVMEQYFNIRSKWSRRIYLRHLVDTVRHSRCANGRSYQAHHRGPFASSSTSVCACGAIDDTDAIVQQFIVRYYAHRRAVESKRLESWVLERRGGDVLRKIVCNLFNEHGIEYSIGDTRCDAVFVPKDNPKNINLDQVARTLRKKLNDTMMQSKSRRPGRSRFRAPATTPEWIFSRALLQLTNAYSSDDPSPNRFRRRTYKRRHVDSMPMSFRATEPSHSKLPLLHKRIWDSMDKGWYGSSIGTIHRALKDLYSQGEDMLYKTTITMSELAHSNSRLVNLRNEMAAHWCLYVHFLWEISGLKERTQANSALDKVSCNDCRDFAISSLYTIVTSCPLVGNHGWLAITLVRMMILRFADGLHTSIDDSTGVDRAINFVWDSIDRAHARPTGECIDLSQTAAVQKRRSARIARLVWLDVVEAERPDPVTCTDTDDSFEALMKLPQPFSSRERILSYVFTDQRSAALLSLEMNRLSDFKEQVFGGDQPPTFKRTLPESGVDAFPLFAACVTYDRTRANGSDFVSAGDDKIVSKDVIHFQSKPRAVRLMPAPASTSCQSSYGYATRTLEKTILPRARDKSPASASSDALCTDFSESPGISACSPHSQQDVESDIWHSGARCSANQHMIQPQRAQRNDEKNAHVFCAETGIERRSRIDHEVVDRSTAGAKTNGQVRSRRKPDALTYGRIECHSKRNAIPEKNKRTEHLPEETYTYLKNWMTAHAHHPYPTKDDYDFIIEKFGVERPKLRKWMSNNRPKYLKMNVKVERPPMAAKRRSEVLCDEVGIAKPKQSPRIQYLPQETILRDQVRIVKPKKPPVQHLSQETRDYLNSWMAAHAEFPYPSPEDKAVFVRLLGIDRKRLDQWMYNYRRKYLTKNPGKREGKVLKRFLERQQAAQRTSASPRKSAIKRKWKEASHDDEDFTDDNDS